MTKRIIAAVLMVLGMAMTPNMALATSLCDDVDTEYASVAGCTDSEKVGNVIENILTVVLSVVGLVAVIVMVIGGVQYTTSSGDPAKTKRARDILIYGIVGLIICLLAYAIVRFVLTSIA